MFLFHIFPNIHWLPWYILSLVRICFGMFLIHIFSSILWLPWYTSVCHRFIVSWTYSDYLFQVQYVLLYRLSDILLLFWYISVCCEFIVSWTYFAYLFQVGYVSLYSLLGILLGHIFYYLIQLRCFWYVSILCLTCLRYYYHRYFTLLLITIPLTSKFQHYLRIDIPKRMQKVSYLCFF